MTKKKKLSAKKPAVTGKAKTGRGSAAELIACAGKKAVRFPLSPEGIKCLREVVEYNDSVGHNSYQRVSAKAVITKLRNDFEWGGTSTAALAKVCEVYLNRASFGAA